MTGSCVYSVLSSVPKTNMHIPVTTLEHTHTDNTTDNADDG